MTSEVLKDRVMVISLMVGCQRTRAKMGIVRTEKGSVRLVMLMINYASAERLGQRQRRSWICDTERNSTPLLRLSPRSCGMDKKHVMCDLVHEQTENPINRQQSMETNFNNSLTSTTMSSHSSQSSHNTLQLARLEQQRVQMRMRREQEQRERKQREREETERQEREEQEIEMAIMAEQARMEEERRRIMIQWELEERQRQEAVEMQLRMEEIWRAQEMEGEEEDEEQEMVAGLSVLKKRKMDDKVSFLTIMERKRKLTKFFKTVESNRKKIVPPCRQCEGAGATCYGKMRRPVIRCGCV